MSEWQPIETAPNLEPILIGWPQSPGKYSKSTWSKIIATRHNDIWILDGSSHHCFLDQWATPPKPTKWHPLPEDPS